MIEPTESTESTESRFCDIGANLADPVFADDVDAVLQVAHSAHVRAIVITGSDHESNAQALDLCERYAQSTVEHPQLRFTAGLHPHHAKDWSSAISEQMLALSTSTYFAAWGEMGLDYNRNFSTPQQQRLAFEKQLEIASQDIGERPVFLHTRDAYNDFATMVREHRDHLTDPLVHCFTGIKEELYGYLDLDCWIGLTGWICDRRRGLHIRELVKDIPLNRLLIETDSPWLMPRDLRSQEIKTNPNYQSATRTRNEPYFLPHIAETIADARPEPNTEVFSALWDNSCRWANLTN